MSRNLLLLLPPSPGVLVCVRRLLELRPDSEAQARAILKQRWPRIGYTTTELVMAHYVDATTEPEGALEVSVVVAPIGVGRVRGETEET